MLRFDGLRRLFESLGVPTDQSAKRVSDFWHWQGNEQIPAHRISAYLFAALGWRISSGGQLPIIKPSVLNDFTAIATYGPYVDAMFVDNECAFLLKQGRLRTEVHLNARIFSLSSRDEFLDYLRGLVDSTPTNVSEVARAIYGLEAA